MTDLPAPLTPADCDLRGLPFMPLDVVRLLDSDLFALSTGEEFKYCIALWCKAWQQVPAGSVPSDDKILAHLSGAGMRWKKVKNVVLRGWIKCSDGRLYHPTVCEKAIEAFPKRKEYQENKTSAAERKQREREDRRALFALLRNHGVTPEYDTPTRKLREMASQFLSQDHVTDSHESHAPVTPDVTAKRETGKGTGKENPPSPPEPKLPGHVRAVFEAGGYVVPPNDLGMIDQWKQAGASLDQDIVPVIRTEAEKLMARTGQPPRTLKIFDQAVREKVAADQREIDRLRRVAASFDDGSLNVGGQQA